MIFSSRSHYDTLGVSRDASLEDIKKAFRELSLQTHPDVAKNKDQIGRFKQISEAYRVLSNKKERGRYDMELSSPLYESGRSSVREPSYYGGEYVNQQNQQAWKSPRPRMGHTEGFRGVVERIFQPRTLFLSLTFGLASLLVARSYIRHDPEKERIKQHKGAKVMIEAWMNPMTGKWEIPAPWDPTYQKLQPTLHLVPRDQVQQQTQSSQPYKR